MTRAAILLLACGCAQTYYPAQQLAPDELVLGQDGGLRLISRDETIASEPTWAGIEARVGCDPKAAVHARAARRHGRRARALAIVGGVLGVASLAAFAGIPFIQREPKKAGAIIGSSLGVGMIGISLSFGSRQQRILANGNAVDAMNYYNDALLSGARCGR
jgi:hypothetical protein